ncbi:hypothetical protein GOP47_0023555 [Adiantum capillus-veneris]|uniref:UBZ4-type domain-containing protein n=1 Tax=Adiantum capillus-veneris TaxID=13818 RepID=A0A9D4U4Q5_ADICA|nr:hypothetical protein GOP47_0023555 [Adiantum capillus-veneris]
MPMEEQVLSPDSPPFQIRHFVSTVRAQDFSRCWPFSHRILKRCLLMGMKVELPPLDLPSNGYISGTCDTTTEISFKCSTKVESCDFSNESDHRQTASMKLAELSRILADSKHAELCGTVAVDLAKNNASFYDKSCLLFSQSRDGAVAVNLPTKSFWDDNVLSLSAGDLSSSSSQLVKEAKAEVADYVGVNLTEKSGGLHVVTADVTINEEPNCNGLFQVTKEESVCTAHTNQLIEPYAGLPSQGVSSEINPSTHQGKVLADRRSPTAVHKPVPQLTEFEGRTRNIEKSKHAINPGLLRSNSDASMPQVCPVCLKFSSGSNTALNAHIDHCLVVDESSIRPLKKRFKIRKLRSMVDIYATASSRTLEDLERSSHAWSLQKS